MDVGLPLLTAIGGSADHPVFELTLVLVLVPLVGRIFLAWAPAGLPGSHTPRDLPTTWAASLLLGAVWLLCTEAVVLTAIPGPLVFGAPEIALVAGVPALALFARLVTAPGGLVPRHEPVREHTPTGLAIGIVAIVLATPVLAVRVDSTQSWIYTGVPTFAAAILAHDALARARVSAWVRFAALALVMAAISVVPSGEHALAACAPLGAAAVAAGTVGWIRRGDRRALVVASAGLVLLGRASPEGIVIAIAAAVCIGIGSAQPSRLRALAWVVPATLVGLVARAMSVRNSDATPDVAIELGGIEWVLLASAAAAFLTAWMLRAKREPAGHNPSGAPVGREAFVLGASAVLAFVWMLGVGGVMSPDRSESASETRGWSGAVWILLVIAAAIALSRALERRPRTK